MLKYFISIAIFVPSIVLSQNQDNQLLIYNVGFGVVTSGVGAVINKPKNSDWKKYLIKGIWQGSIGGFLHYAGKKSSYNFITEANNTATYIIPKILHSAGSSIIESSALDKPFLKDWHFEYGPVRVDFSTVGSEKCCFRFLPYFINSVLSISQYHNADNKYVKIDFVRSLSLGVLTFKGNDLLFTNQNYGNAVSGSSSGRVICYSKDLDNYTQTIAHENIHTFQFGEYQLLNTWFNKLVNQFAPCSIEKLFAKYIYADIPYFSIPYRLEGINNENHYKNFFEFEAQRFSTNQFVQRY